MSSQSTIEAFSLLHSSFHLNQDPISQYLQLGNQSNQIQNNFNIHIGAYQHQSHSSNSQQHQNSVQPANPEANQARKKKKKSSQQKNMPKFIIKLVKKYIHLYDSRSNLQTFQHYFNAVSSYLQTVIPSENQNQQLYIGLEHLNQLYSPKFFELHLNNTELQHLSQEQRPKAQQLLRLITSKIIQNHLKKEVLHNNKVTEKNKLIYLKCLKIFQLRCRNTITVTRIESN